MERMRERRGGVNVPYGFERDNDDPLTTPDRASILGAPRPIIAPLVLREIRDRRGLRSMGAALMTTAGIGERGGGGSSVDPGDSDGGRRGATRRREARPPQVPNAVKKYGPGGSPVLGRSPQPCAQGREKEPRRWGDSQGGDGGSEKGSNDQDFSCSFSLRARVSGLWTQQ